MNMPDEDPMADPAQRDAYLASWMTTIQQHIADDRKERDRKLRGDQQAQRDQPTIIGQSGFAGGVVSSQ